MGGIIVLITMLLLILSVIEFSVTMNFGWLIKKSVRKHCENVFRYYSMYLSDYDDDNFHVVGIYRLIYRCDSVLTKYCISGYGRVPRWSKLHRQFNKGYSRIKSQNIHRRDFFSLEEERPQEVNTHMSGRTTHNRVIFSGGTQSNIVKKIFKFGR